MPTPDPDLTAASALVPWPEAPAAAPADDGADVERWIASLGPSGPEMATRAGGFLTDLGGLLSAAGPASQTANVSALEDLQRRGHILNAQTAGFPLDWVRMLVEGGFRTITGGLEMARGNRSLQQWRHERAKREFGAARAAYALGVGSLRAGLAGVPTLAPLSSTVQQMNLYVRLLEQLDGMIAKLEENAALETLLLNGRIVEYIAGVRVLADAMRSQSEQILDLGHDSPDLLALSAQLASLAEMLQARAESIEEHQRTREIYLPTMGDKVFIIHGHAEDKWRELRDLLEEKLGLRGRVVVLKEEASRSRTVLAKFEEVANECSFGFALVTPDDVVNKADKTYRQARPNVLFEIGWFFGRYGPSRLCILRKGANTALPSDLNGVVTLDFNDQVEEQFLRIQEELKAAAVLG